ncbi:MAG: Gfo/Idh/MocA family oxidoreductase [Paludibacter sp.]|nr:Gfo/Idh/MocA family oxidoreductase [Paludibacter sp.]
MDKINWGIIGCGNVTELKSGPAFNKVEHSRLVAVMRRNAALAEDYAKRHQISRFYTDADELINDPEVNAVYVATPPDTHAMYAIKAMKAGKPVYVEKPMARTYTECQEMIRVSEVTGMPLYVAYYRRTLPAFLKVKTLLEEGAIGKLLTVNIRLHKAFGEKDQYPEQQSWHVNPEIAGAGYFYDLASHQLDYLDFVLGQISEVKGVAHNIAGFYKAEDTVSAVFAFDSGVTGTGSWCFVVDKNSEEDKIEIIGTKGTISFPCFEKGNVEMTIGYNKSTYNFQNHENISFYLVEQVVGALREENKCVSTAYSAARTNFIMEEIIKSYYKK